MGRARLAFPTTGVTQLIEYTVAGPVPLGRPWLAGVGFHLGRALLSISLAEHEAQGLPFQRKARGVWLKASSDEACVVAVEVARSLGLITVIGISPIRRSSGVPLPSWLKEATTSDGRRIGWVEPSELLNDFGGGIGRS